MDIERLQERIADFTKALHQLDKAVQQPGNEFIRDCVIQRFEFAYELAGKMLKIRLEMEDIFAKTPKETLQEALQAGFIVDGNAWSELQKNRNLTVHAYNEQLAEQIYRYIAQQAVVLFHQLLEKAAQW
ncbi:MAG: nucleotidyltransferase substrate binding protein [Gammaproteobacteria bacterium]|nr:nucleotidyltransferase substrate binding protein [Gammaproteobacteria bacterium]